MYELSEITVELGGHAALGIDRLNVAGDAVTVVLGHNGSGKSTLMALLARQRRPSTGEIRLNGTSLQSYSQRRLARSVAYLPQRLPEAPGLTVRELCGLGRFAWTGALGRWGAGDERVVSDALARTGVAPLADRLVDLISGGERQRAWIAMLLAQESPILLLDEPISALDLAHQVEVLRLLRELTRSARRGVIVVLHDVNLAAHFADRIIALKSGRVVLDGPPHALMRRDTLADLYGISLDLVDHPSRGIPLAVLSLAVLLPACSSFAATIVDSRGPQSFASPPERVVALSWAMVEQLLELGITPVGVADADGYAVWVARPPIPEGVTSVGLRQEPNLERIAALRPDVILVSDDQIDLVPHLEKIAPVLHFDAFSADHDNLAASRRIYLELAKLFDRETAARTRLTRLDARLAALAEAVRRHFGDTGPKVTVVRFLDDARVLVHGDNAMPVFALEAIGLESGFPLPATRWGITNRKVQELGFLDGIVLHIEPFDKAGTLFSSPLWKAMPFVRTGRFGALPPTWTYGGALSVEYLAEAITDALLKIKPQ
jgi:ABC-type cobalamin/Fe3+-siderophores transport system ATPase subunit/ABC-type Fe3+-hydroxamate transport system substrate-binding protein